MSDWFRFSLLVSPLYLSPPDLAVLCAFTLILPSFLLALSLHGTGHHRRISSLPPGGSLPLQVLLKTVLILSLSLSCTPSEKIESVLLSGSELSLYDCCTCFFVTLAKELNPLPSVRFSEGVTPKCPKLVSDPSQREIIFFISVTLILD